LADRIYSRTLQYSVLASIDTVNSIEPVPMGGGSGLMKSISSYSPTIATYDLYVFETDPSASWVAGSPEEMLHNLCVIESADSTDGHVWQVNERAFACRDTSTADNLWVGLKNGTTTAATVYITMRYSVADFTENLDLIIDAP